MSLNKKLIYYTLLAVSGITIFILSLCFNFEDSFWNGIGTGLFIVACINIFRILKYKNNSTYAKKVTIETNDERNKFLAEKARSIAFYFYILLACIVSLILRFFNLHDASQILLYSVCCLLIIYYVSYFIVGQKY